MKSCLQFNSLREVFENRQVGNLKGQSRSSQIDMEAFKTPHGKHESFTMFFLGAFMQNSSQVGMYIIFLFVIPFIHLCHCWFLRWYFLSNCAEHSRLLVTLPHIHQITGRRSNSDGIDESERQTDRGLRSPGVSKSYLPDFLSGCHWLYKLWLCRVTGPARLA